MPDRRMVTLLISVILLFPGTSYPRQRSSNQTITWYRADFPPVTIVEGPNAGLGFFDRVTDLLSDQLPDYDHRHQVANFKRIIIELKNKKNVCCPSLYKTRERDTFISFSIPAMVVLPNVLITQKSLKDKLGPYLDRNKRVGLTGLLENKNIRLGISNGRKYSGGIDEVLSQFQGAENISIRSGEDVFKGLLDMLFLGRIDCIIGYPIEASYFLKGKPEFNKLQIYFIAENKIDFTIGHVGCPKTEWGEKIIERVNQVLIEHRQTPEYLDFYEHWLNDDTVPFYKKTVADYYDGE